MRGLISFLVGILLLSKSVFAGEFPFIEILPSHIKIAESGKVEAKLRLRLIRKAAQSVDLITFDQRADETVSMPLLKALREAADRNVKVRFIRGSFSSRIYSKYYAERKNGDPVESYLTDPPTQTPIQYVEVGSPGMVFNGWSPLIGAHEKLIIIDKKIAIMTGRGQSAIYVNWMDAFHLIKGPLVAQVDQAYESIWNLLSEEDIFFDDGSGNEAPNENRIQAPSKTTPHPPLPLSKKERRNFETLKKWIDTPAQPIDSVHPNVRMRARLIHHDLLHQLKDVCGTAWIYNYTSCLEKTRDPILHRKIELIQEASEVQLYTLLLKLHPLIKEALIQRLEEKNAGGREFKLKIFTNGKEAFTEIVHWPKNLYKLGWGIELPDIEELMRYGANVFTFEQNPEANTLRYLHRKGMIVKIPPKPPEKKVKIHYISGSHNTNTGSTLVTSELDLETESYDLGNSESQRFNKVIETNGKALNYDEIQVEQSENKLPWPFGWVWKLSMKLTEGFI